MPRSVAELLPSIPLATTSQDGLAAATQIATLGALELAAGDGNTIEEGADFAAGATYTVDPADPRDRWLKVLGATDGPLTANMIVSLNVASGGWAGQQGIAWGMVRKADTTAFTVTVTGFDTSGTGTRVLRQQGDFVQWRLVNTDLANGPGPGGSKFDDMLITRRASVAEVAAATDTERFVTPASLSAQITKSGGTFLPNAIDLSVTRAYDDYPAAGAIELALSGATPSPGATATVRRTGASVTVTVNGTTVFWADGDTGAKTWSDKQTLALYYHPGLAAALAIVPGDGGGGGTWGTIGGTLNDQVDLLAALDAKLALAGGTLTGLLRLIGLIQNYATAHTHSGSGAVAPNLASGAVGAIRVTLNANGTSWAPTNVPTTTTARYPVTVRFIQGAAGGFTLTLSALDWGSPGPPTLGTTAGDWLEVMMVYDHGTLYPRYVDSRTA